MDEMREGMNKVFDAIDAVCDIFGISKDERDEFVRDFVEEVVIPAFKEALKSSLYPKPSYGSMKHKVKYTMPTRPEYRDLLKFETEYDAVKMIDLMRDLNDGYINMGNYKKLLRNNFEDPDDQDREIRVTTTVDYDYGWTKDMIDRLEAVQVGKDYQIRPYPVKVEC